MSPELLAFGAQPHKGADLWAFGLTIIRLASPFPLWHHATTASSTTNTGGSSGGAPGVGAAGLILHIVAERTHPLPELLRSGEGKGEKKESATTALREKLREAVDGCLLPLAKRPTARALLARLSAAPALY
eukprot:TRINITY_DN62467_c0_g1_i1.p3 TRINITY_DN62467_c0_g1~~TRINITY_DN62467_c0_g1_i1.p3  ORF type:complete len:131 (+),score=19.62 TRINITY_DN62467_c0_g1_i1:2-394(+)